jgi:hypothetical protein
VCGTVVCVLGGYFFFLRFIVSRHEVPVKDATPLPPLTPSAIHLRMVAVMEGSPLFGAASPPEKPPVLKFVASCSTAAHGAAIAAAAASFREGRLLARDRLSLTTSRQGASCFDA